MRDHSCVASYSHSCLALRPTPAPCHSKHFLAPSLPPSSASPPCPSSLARFPTAPPSFLTASPHHSDFSPSVSRHPRPPTPALPPPPPLLPPPLLPPSSVHVTRSPSIPPPSFAPFALLHLPTLPLPSRCLRLSERPFSPSQLPPFRFAPRVAYEALRSSRRAPPSLARERTPALPSSKVHIFLLESEHRPSFLEGVRCLPRSSRAYDALVPRKRTPSSLLNSELLPRF
ncbi:hypothetical protein K523DRAFT_148997 [Schizophyllum commune Tattone D]|nr:hypothetical protein K523DRAFT_148997 [Schizophyllum commune Tattone D]